MNFIIQGSFCFFWLFLNGGGKALHPAFNAPIFYPCSGLSCFVCFLNARTGSLTLERNAFHRQRDGVGVGRKEFLPTVKLGKG